jgi:hypothetical protein
MHLHLPKPLHGWRELAFEITVVVVGILIALALDQAVGAYNDRQRTDEAVRAIDADIRQGLATAQVMTDIQACQRQQLSALSDAVGRDDLPGAGRLLAQSALYDGQVTSNSSWTATVSSDISNQFDGRRRARYHQLFYMLDKESNWVSDFYRSQSRLMALTQSGLARSKSSGSAAVAELAEMSSILDNMQGAFGDFRTAADQGLGMTVRQRDIDALPIDRNAVAKCKAAAMKMTSSAVKAK